MCSIKKLFLSISQNPQETPVLETLFVKVAGLKAFTNTYFDEHLRTAASASCGYGNFFYCTELLIFYGHHVLL